MSELFWGVYLVGVVIALLVMRDPWGARVGTALVWPLGPLAFVMVISILLVASLLLWPLLIVPAISAAGVVWWMLA